MKQTFEELLKDKRKLPNTNGNYYSETTVIELLKLVRQKTLIETSNCCKKYLSYDEIYDKIYELDKNSIEI